MPSFGWLCKKHRFLFVRFKFELLSAEICVVLRFNGMIPTVKDLVNDQIITVDRDYVQVSNSIINIK